MQGARCTLTFPEGFVFHVQDGQITVVPNVFHFCYVFDSGAVLPHHYKRLVGNHMCVGHDTCRQRHQGRGRGLVARTQVSSATDIQNNHGRESMRVDNIQNSLKDKINTKIMISSTHVRARTHPHAWKKCAYTATYVFQQL